MEVLPERLETGRLWLVALGPEWAPEVCEMLARNRIYWGRYEPAPPERCWEVGYQAEVLRNQRAQRLAGRSAVYYLVEKRRMGALAGCVRVDRRAGWGQVGYRLEQALQGQGLMTEALRAVCEAALGAMALTGLRALIAQDNIASLRVAEKAGFAVCPAGLHLVRINGRWARHVRLERLKNESSWEVAICSNPSTSGPFPRG